MDYDKLTKEELISLLRELESQRAFTYEDRMKLEILDQSPFTIWASDRDCKITFWDGQCEHLRQIRLTEMLEIFFLHRI